MNDSKLSTETFKFAIDESENTKLLLNILWKDYQKLHYKKRDIITRKLPTILVTATFKKCY